MKVITLFYCDQWKGKNSFSEPYIFNSGRALSKFICKAIRNNEIETGTDMKLVKSYARNMQAYALNDCLDYAYVEEANINPE